MPTASLSASDADAVDTANEKLRKRVADALHVDPYFYDKHVTVSVNKGTGRRGIRHELMGFARGPAHR